ncbi:hypothetical protein [Silvanigrella aquatica]|uniref:Uncharacterized protein n=1 Tax=Silvanigrella aquatica TaxID=1915309 RepID=A0A1L4D3G6_9BACT|nr:hypothetical protein [Silvanigrella aquatica]APJ04740.1 hypothetical protein AXG55_12870 [Silvanigrella aquatica]
MGIFNKSGSSDLENANRNISPVLAQGNSKAIDPEKEQIEEPSIKFNKYAQKNLAEHIQLSLEEKKYYFGNARNLCVYYFSCLSELIESKSKLNNQNIMKTSESKIIDELIKIYEDKNKNHEIKKIERIYNIDKIKKMYTLDSFLYSIKINECLKEESNKKHYFDRMDFYVFSPSDVALFNMFIVPIIGFHTVVFSIAIPPIGSVLATTQTFAILTGVGSAKTALSEGVKSLYNVLKGNKYYLYEGKSYESNCIIEKIVKQKLTGLEALKSALAHVQESTSRTGQFTYFFANSFKYYCLLKENCEKFNNICSSYYTKDRVDLKTFQKEMPKIKDYYNKTFYYLRSNKIIASTLRIQIESLKATTLQSMFLLVNDSTVQKFFKTLDIKKTGNKKSKTENTIEKYLKNKYRKVDNSLAEQLSAFVIATMNTDSIKYDDIKLKFNDEKKSAEEKKTPYQEFKSYFDEFQHPADSARRLVYLFANLPFSKEYFTNLQSQTYAINFGAWVAFSVFDAILYKSNSNFAKDKYATLRSWSGNIANGAYSFFHVLGVVDLFSKITGLFSNSIISNLAFSPFGILIDVGIINLFGQVSSNEVQIWKDIENKYVDAKSKKSSKNLNDTAFRFFTKAVAFMPGDSIHKLGNMFRERLKTVANLSVKINADSLAIIDGIKEIQGEKAPKRKFTRAVTSEDVVKKYTKTLMNIFTLAKELEALQFYMDNIVTDMNEEMDQALQFYSIICGVNSPEAFSIMKFAKKKEIFEEFFVKNLNKKS